MSAIKWTDQHGRVRWQPAYLPDKFGHVVRRWKHGGYATAAWYESDEALRNDRPSLFRWKWVAELVLRGQLRRTKRRRRRSRWTEAE